MEVGPIVRAMRHNKVRFGMIIIEIAITLAIVTNSINMILEERRLIQISSGFDDENLVWMRSRPFAPDFRDDRYLELNTDADRRAIESIPGVKRVANTTFIPWQGGGSSGEVRPTGATDKFRTQFYYSTPEIFETLGVNVIEGRAFTEGDMPPLTPAATPGQPAPAATPGQPAPVGPSPTVVIISKSLAKLLFKDGKAIGQRIEQADGSEGYLVIGVIDKFYNPYGWPIHEYVVFLPSRVGSYRNGTRFLIRLERGAARAALPAIEQRLVKENPGRLIELKTINEIKDTYFSGGRMVIKLMTGMIILLVAVTAIGILGIASFSVTERTRQIGTRRALGATRGDILRYFLLENWLITTAGLVLGVVAAYALNILLVSQVSGVKLDWMLVAIGAGILWLTGLAATLVPALRGSSLSPAVATRTV